MAGLLPHDVVMTVSEIENLEAVVAQGVGQVQEFVAHRIATEADRATFSSDVAGPWWSGLASQIGGKWFRPSLALAAYWGCGGRRFDEIVPIGAAIEVLHTAMLIHDDLLDGDDIRRGNWNIEGQYRHWGQQRGLSGAAATDVAQAASVLTGDVALALALDMAMQVRGDADQLRQVHQMLTRAVQVSAEGELVDILAETASQSFVASQIAAAKTAHYSCQLPLEIGALMAGADASQRAALVRSGLHLGLAFQAVDDVLGVFGQPEQTGKSVVCDLKRGKQTLLLQWAMEHASAADRRVLDHLIGHPELSHSDAAEIRAIFHRCGAVAAVREVVKGHVERVRKESSGQVPTKLVQYLMAVADRIVETLP